MFSSVDKKQEIRYANLKLFCILSAVLQNVGSGMEDLSLGYHGLACIYHLGVVCLK